MGGEGERGGGGSNQGAFCKVNAQANAAQPHFFSPGQPLAPLDAAWSPAAQLQQLALSTLPCPRVGQGRAAARADPSRRAVSFDFAEIKTITLLVCWERC